MTVAVVGAGPAGLMAAEVLTQAGVQVDLYDAMPSVGRKFLLAGKGGLNLTHSEDAAPFTRRFGARAPEVGAWLQGFGAEAVRAWAAGLGVETFVGSSGRVFPKDMKAAPLLRAWLQRLRHPASAPGVRFHMRHRLEGTDGEGRLLFATPDGPRGIQAEAVVLALGGASWPRLGSDGAWAGWLPALGAQIAPLRAANCGFERAGGWSAYFRERFAGQPFKAAALRFEDSQGEPFARRGEFVVTDHGVEGSLVYAASAPVRDEIERAGQATVFIDLKPDFSAERVAAEVSHPRGARSLANHLKSRLNLDAISVALLHEVLGAEGMRDPAQLAAAVNSVPLVLCAARPVAEAISTAGGVRLESLTNDLMLQARAGWFLAGEMLDWEAPTGGYLLTASMASGRIAGFGAADWLARGTEAR